MMIDPTSYFSTGDAENPVFLREGRTVSRGEFAADVAALAAVLRSAPEPTVALWSADNLSFAVGFMACVQAGKHIILPPNISKGSYAAWGEGVRFLVDKRSADSPAGTLEIGGHPPCPLAACTVKTSDIGVSFYTSGSTGAPKRIDRTLAHLMAEVYTLAGCYETGSPHTVLPTVSFHHAFGIILAFLLPLCSGQVIDTSPLGGVEPFVNRLHAVAGDVWVVSTPSFLSVWGENGDLYPLQRPVQRLFSAAAPLGEETATVIKRMTGAEITEIYGSSETGIIARRSRPQQTPWRPFPGVHTELQGEQRSLCIRSPFVAPQEGICPGDSALLHADGTFTLQPRTDRVVKVMDKRISLPELEQKLEAHPMVRQAAAIVVPQGTRTHIAVALVPTAEGVDCLKHGGYQALKTTLRKHLADTTDPTLIPRRWRVLGEFPTDAQGKIRLQVLRDILQDALQIPLLLPLHRTENETEYRVIVVKDASFFAGHFPGYPILPGVVEGAMVDHAIRMQFHRRLTAIKRLKFCAVVEPGHECRLHVKRIGENKAQAEMSLMPEDKLCMQGSVIME